MQGIPAEATRVREGDILQRKYKVERVLGVGGMGFVVAAHHLELDEKVAIKSLLPQGLGQPEALLRFEREARAAVKIKSEHVARVLDVARFDDGTPYLVMEYLDGSDLSSWLRTRGPLPVEQAIELVIQACEAIAEAHTLGIVHRDLKPANLFVIKGRDGLLKAKVLDFGISKSAESWSGPEAMTRTRSVLGSPLYMSPEQFTAPKTVDGRTDIWSIGVTLFELLAGRAPFTANDLVELVVRIAQQPAPPVTALRPDVPAGLSSVVLRCLQKDRAARYRDVAELVAALAPFAPSRTQPLVERIARIVGESGPTGLAATAFAQSASVSPVAPTRCTREVSSWPSQHPAARPPEPSERALRPLVATIRAPAIRRPRHGRDVVHGVMAMALIAGVIAIVSASGWLWRRSSGTVVARGLPAQEARTEASTEPSTEASSASSLSAPPELPPLAPAPDLSSKSPRLNASASSFRGTHAVTRATWRFGSGAYHAIIHTNGATGYADVQTVEPGGGPVVIREDLRLQRGPRGWTYVGSNPRNAEYGDPADFSPNVFHLEQGTGGAWRFVETCAIGTGMCTHVSSDKGN